MPYSLFKYNLIRTSQKSGVRVMSGVEGGTGKFSACRKMDAIKTVQS